VAGEEHQQLRKVEKTILLYFKAEKSAFTPIIFSKASPNSCCIAGDIFLILASK
jgi:hypothetical protein